MVDAAFSMAGGGAAYLGAAAGPSTYLHELGHKWAVDALYQNGNPSISVTPFGGGKTTWMPGELSPLGRRLGENGSRAAVSAAGTCVDVLTSTALFAAGYKLRKKHPIVGGSLMAYAGLQMANSVYYAASGLSSAAAARPGHDFLNLQRTIGLPCWASAAILVSILPAEYLLLKALDKQAA